MALTFSPEIKAQRQRLLDKYGLHGDALKAISEQMNGQPPQRSLVAFNGAIIQARVLTISATYAQLVAADAQAARDQPEDQVRQNRLRLLFAGL